VLSKEYVPDERATEEIVREIELRNILRSLREIPVSPWEEQPQAINLDALGPIVVAGVAAGAAVALVGSEVLLALADKMSMQQFGLVLQATLTGAAVFGAGIATRIKRR
jgi:hypothetical protein